MKRRGRGALSTALIGAILGSAITLGVTYIYLPDILDSRGIPPDSAPPQQHITIEPAVNHTVYSAVAKKAMPSVVGITTVELQRDLFFGMREVAGVGTGVIIDKRGYILTNSHVVRDGKAREVKALLNDGRQLKAEVLWNDGGLDLAIIKIEGNNLPTAELGDSDGVEVGEIAVAIGNPLGLNFQRSLTQGVISGLNRTITDSVSGTTIENLIQTDASINPGNSGGPLLNSKGQVIGINTAKITSGEGLGFAIPINTAKPIVDQFIEKGEFTRVFLGIQGVDIDVVESLMGIELPVDNGVYVAQVVENSVAARYGILAGDIIIKVGNINLDKRSDLERAIYKFRPGDRTTVTVLRVNKEVKINVVFD
ncbi:MAG: trypsin-like serine protease [Clostridiales bacterium]|nr:trypsin-like peptidase domain-containing protein [Bacillota bacterium]NLK90429.1 trypsin-like serine protease [Clostridiales bacterium]